jgi:hypothetical protein
MKIENQKEDSGRRAKKGTALWRRRGKNALE